MPKSPSSNLNHFQIGIYIVVLMIGVGIGAILPLKTKTVEVEVPSPATDCSSFAAEPRAVELLGSPVFRDPGTITSSVDGMILVRWNTVPGAKSYNVRVWNEEGRELKNFLAPKTFTYLKNLPVDPRQKETPYYVVVTPIGDTPDQRGKDSERKQLAMLPLRNLEPPTIKSIQTEKEEQPK